MKVLIKKKFVDLMNSARDPLKKHETLFQKKEKKKKVKCRLQTLDMTAISKWIFSIYNSNSNFPISLPFFLLVNI